jgi:hypothetical protein
VHERQAIRLLVRKGLVLPLRTLDALQLSAALWLKSQQQLDHFLCADPKLCEAAQQEGLQSLTRKRHSLVRHLTAGITV